MRFLDPNGRFPDQNQGFGSDGDPVARTLLSTTLVSLLSQTPRDETLAPIGCAFRKMTGGGSLRHVELWLDFREDLKPWPLAG